jgi:hypothetical protein
VLLSCGELDEGTQRIVGDLISYHNDGKGRAAIGERLREFE